MCGILGYIGGHNSTEVLLEGLRKLEYRGYDSAGIAVMVNGAFEIRRSVGKLGELESLLRQKPVDGPIGLGHTRWATHGAPSEVNAHPHADSTCKIIVVDNCIIENYETLKKKLQAQGVEFKSQTDTEAAAHLISSYWRPLSEKNSKNKKETLVEAVRLALKDIEGTFALGIACSEVPDAVIGARRDCPLIVGIGQGENFLASDVPAILSRTRDVMFLEDGDIAVLTRTGAEVLDSAGKPVERKVTKITWDPLQAEKSGYKHFMLKEIHEQPRIIEDTLMGRLHHQTGEVALNGDLLSETEVKNLSHVRFLACGTSWHAALVGSYLVEKYAGLPCQVDIASEFRYRDPILEPGTLVVAISQSGETADTLAAARLAKQKGAKVLAIANVVGSSLMREADSALLTHCGPEIGVASTKAFMGQLVALHLMALYLAQVKKAMPPERLIALGKDLAHLSQWITASLECEEAVTEVAKKFFRRKNFLYLGRNVNYPIAMEGALKLKEISYIHAEGYPAGEMKHGPIALIDENMPIVAISTRSRVYDKMISNIEEVKSRGGEVIAIATEGDAHVKDQATHVIYVPDVPEDLTPLVNVVPLQILAYKIAVLLGCDVDQPRNLAKSVTVE